MFEKQRKTGKGLIFILALTVILLVLFVAMLLSFAVSAGQTADTDIGGGFADVFKYHFRDVKGFLTFNFNHGSNIIYAGLSAIFYIFVLIAIAVLIIGIIVMVKNKRRILIPSILFAWLVIVVFFFAGTGAPKYWAIINQRGAFSGDKTLQLPTLLILISSVLYVLFAYISFLLSIREAKINPRIQATNTPVIENLEEPETPSEEEAVQFETIETEQVQPVREEPVAPQETRVEPATEEPKQEEPKEELNKESLASMLREVVRDIVRDEIARNNANQPKNNEGPLGSTLTGATFGGPLVVQYFNGGINGVNPAQNQPVEQVAPAPQVAPEQPKEEPRVEEKEPEPQPEPEQEQAMEEPVVGEQPIEEPVQEEPAAEPAQVEEVVAPVEKKPIIRIPFQERMLSADPEMQNNYNELKNEILSYGVNSRVSNSGDTFRLHRKTYVKITIAGLSLKLYFALDPNDYKDSTLPVQDAGHKGIYEEIPLVFKVKSGLSMRRCKQLIQDVMEKDGLEQGEIGAINWVEELKAAPSEEGQPE